MRDQILALQQKGSILNPDAAQRHNDRQAVIEFAEQFIERLTSNKAFVRPKSLKGKLEHPENPLGQWALILDELEHHMITNGLNPASGGHLGYIPGGGIHSCALGDYLAAVTNQYA
ncbi:MAG TPA: amino acid decarboxylase, partial [Saprospiraceae bacterium]|nr:amino acid decarboxylase [Saprospiraceae bacterium]